MAIRPTVRLLRRTARFSHTVAFSPQESEEFFKFTECRWLYNENQQNAIRYAKFNISALQDVACKAIGADSCIEFTKLSEGSYNKVFLLRFSGGKEVIARVPMPVAGPPWMTTASEVATMTFAREVLNVPAPRVLAWSSDAVSNAVGSAYIIMEKIDGQILLDRWPLVTDGGDAATMLFEFAGIEKKFQRVPFSQIGSLYFKEDVSPELQDRPLFHAAACDLDDIFQAAAKRYRVGPISNRQWWRGERASMRLDRGPWPDAAAYYLAAIQSARAWTEHLDSVEAPFCQPPSHSAVVHRRILDLCAKVIPAIIPPEPDLCMPVLWHPDISERNIVVPETGALNVLGLIDWQHAVVKPYYLQANFPPAFQCEEETLAPTPVSMPKLPADYDTYTPEKQAIVRRQHRLMMQHKGYEMIVYTITDSQLRVRANWLPARYGRGNLPFFALRCWGDGIAPLLKCLLQLRERWSEVVGEANLPCPIDFSQIEEEEFSREVSRADRYTSVTMELREYFAIGADGLVSPERYDECKQECERLARLWNEEECGGPFPYKDGMHSICLS